jgi:hypothetical protein
VVGRARTCRSAPVLGRSNLFHSSHGTFSNRLPDAHCCGRDDRTPLTQKFFCGVRVKNPSHPHGSRGNEAQTGFRFPASLEPPYVGCYLSKRLLEPVWKVLVGVRPSSGAAVWIYRARSKSPRPPACQPGCARGRAHSDRGRHRRQSEFPNRLLALLLLNGSERTLVWRK